MNTKGFVLMLIGVLVLGGSLGGAFIGGMAVGKAQGEETAPSTPSSPSLPSAGQSSSGQFSQEQLEQFRQRLQGQFGQGATGQGFAGRSGLTGTIEEIGEGTVTINTPQGPLQATIGAETVIQMFAEGALEDLETGMQVTVVGQRGDDGNVDARSIVIIPEGADGLFGGGLFPGGNR